MNIYTDYIYIYMFVCICHFKVFWHCDRTQFGTSSCPRVIDLCGSTAVIIRSRTQNNLCVLFHCYITFWMLTFWKGPSSSAALYIGLYICECIYIYIKVHGPAAQTLSVQAAQPLNA